MGTIPEINFLHTTCSSSLVCLIDIIANFNFVHPFFFFVCTHGSPSPRPIDLLLSFLLFGVKNLSQLLTKKISIRIGIHWKYLLQVDRREMESVAKNKKNSIEINSRFCKYSHRDWDHLEYKIVKIRILVVNNDSKSLQSKTNLKDL